MASDLRLLCILAHPDDESLGNGGTLARYAAEGVSTHLVTATRGQRGWAGPPDSYPGPAETGTLREAELRAAAAVLGLQSVHLLDYMDGDLDQVESAELTAGLANHIRQIRPHVVITFGPDGAYGHPDHIAISQSTTSAIICAADPTCRAPHRGSHHRVSKLYYMAAPDRLVHHYEAIFGDLVMQVDGVERRMIGWEDWAITTWLDTSAYWHTAWQAVRCHRTQLPAEEVLSAVSEEQLARLWSQQWYYRAFSLVNGGRWREDDLFEGLR